MATAFEAVHTHRVTPDFLGLQGMTNRGAFVNNLDPGVFEKWHISFGAAARGFNDFHAAFHDGVNIFRIGRCAETWQEGQVNADRLVRHILATRDLVGEVFRRFLSEGRNNAQAARI